MADHRATREIVQEISAILGGGKIELDSTKIQVALNDLLKAVDLLDDRVKRIEDERADESRSLGR